MRLASPARTLRLLHVHFAGESKEQWLVAEGRFFEEPH